MPPSFTRRQFLHTATAAGVCVGLGKVSAAPAANPAPKPQWPLVDFHVHLDNSTIEKVAALGTKLGVKFGIVEHAGTKENDYPVVLSNDAELRAYLAMLAPHPVYKGLQAEWTDWRGCFSDAALAQVDYVLSDAMTFPGPGGRRTKLWLPGFELGEAQAFMDRFTDWHVHIMAVEPIDILAHPTWLPAAIADRHDELWTEARMRKIVAAAVRYNVAIELSAAKQVPRLPFLRMAKAAGLKFSFGSNGRYPQMGQIDYALAMARELKLKATDMFTPAPAGKKPFQIRKFA
jgi:histidinol phosphatase-like PHP family hydrolase